MLEMSSLQSDVQAITSRSEFDHLYNEALHFVHAIDDPVRRKRIMAAQIYPSDAVDVALMKLEYRLQNARDLNFDDPQDFSAKLHWLKSYDRRVIYGVLADMYAVRGYVSGLGLGHILNRCYGVFVDPMEIDDAVLPTTFVIKATHGRDMSIVVTDNDTFDWDRCRVELTRWLGIRHEERHGEWAYALASPRLMIEESLQNDARDRLLRYEIFCFDGEARFLKAKSPAPACRHYGFFTSDWQSLPFHYSDAQMSDVQLEKPAQLQQMLIIAERLSHAIPFVRVDLFIWNEEIRFGNLTLYPRGGNTRLVPEEWHLRVGAMLTLPGRI